MPSRSGRTKNNIKDLYGRDDRHESGPLTQRSAHVATRDAYPPTEIRRNMPRVAPDKLSEVAELLEEWEKRKMVSIHLFRLSRTSARSGIDAETECGSPGP